MSDFRDIIMQGADQRSAMWRKIRQGRATSSEISVLFPQRSPEKKFAEQHDGFGQGAVTYIAGKALEIYKDEEIRREVDTYETRWGKVFEESASKIYELTYGDDTLTSMGFVPYGKLAGGSPDRLSRVRGVMEIKCPANAENHAFSILELNTLADLKAFNYKYWWQIQSLCYFLAVPFGFFVSFDPREYKKAWTPNDWEGFSPEFAFESSDEFERSVGLHIIEGELDKNVPEMIEEMLPRFKSLRNRFVNQLIEKKGLPPHLSGWNG
jgi:hypothetical protein